MSDAAPQACRPVWAKRLERAFVGRPSRRRAQKLRRHATACADCRAAFDRLAFAERALYGSAFPHPARERAAPPAARAPRRLGRLWAPAGALAAAAAAIVLWIVTSPPTPPRPEFRARGVESALGQLAPGEREPGVRLFCVRVSDTGAEVTDEVHMAPAAMPAPTLTCTIDDELQIAYSTPNLPGLTMIVFADSPSGATQWYAPMQAGALSVPLAPDAIDTPLSWSTRLGAEHRPGTYDVEARVFVGPAAAAPGAANPAAELRARLVVEEAPEEAP